MICLIDISSGPPPLTRGAVGPTGVLADPLLEMRKASFLIFENMECSFHGRIPHCKTNIL